MGTTAAESTQDGALFDDVHKTIVDTIIKVVGQDFYEESEITLDSTFAEDIEIESTELLEIAEKLMETYESVDFVAWLSDMDLEDIIDISLRDFVNFIVSSLEGRELASN